MCWWTIVRDSNHLRRSAYRNAAARTHLRVRAARRRAAARIRNRVVAHGFSCGAGARAARRGRLVVPAADQASPTGRARCIHTRTPGVLVAAAGSDAGRADPAAGDRARGRTDTGVTASG